ncbi:EcsC family protein [Komagataeibacter europaeus]|uniref:EcsC family protein n=1 Tax=Komagataeibacter europaeus TaxID=33995 RepID=UPI001E3BFE01|nr:EcsC family protein [Komagataeibacter europaeus]
MMAGSHDSPDPSLTRFIDWAYQASVAGVGRAGSAEDVARACLARNGGDTLRAARALIRRQNAKAATAGFISGLGGLATLPLALPANVAGVLYVQVRMITAIAVMGGHDIRDADVKAACLSCLTEVGLEEVAKNIGLSIAGSAAVNNIGNRVVVETKKHLARHALHAVAARGLAGGAAAAVPVLGGVIGGTFDGLKTNRIGRAAIRQFITQPIPARLTPPHDDRNDTEA